MPRETDGAGVRFLCTVRRRDPRSPGRGHIRALKAHPPGRPGLQQLYSDLLQARRRIGPGEVDEIEYDEQERWLRVDRGGHRARVQLRLRAAPRSLLGKIGRREHA